MIVRDSEEWSFIFFQDRTFASNSSLFRAIGIVFFKIFSTFSLISKEDWEREYELRRLLGHAGNNCGGKI